MRKSVGLNGLISAVGLMLLPLAVPAESHLEGEGQHSAEAHLMFKVVIPQMLSVEIGQTLSIGSNHGVFQLATGGAEAERHQIILSGSGHRSIAQFVACTHARARDNAAMNCTVSMP